MARGFGDSRNMKFKQIVGPLRAALSGRTVTPGLFETLVLLGKEVCVKRIQNSLSWKAPAKAEVEA